jgi:glycosyltransferase involved in cell wall biosynthesis
VAVPSGLETVAHHEQPSFRPLIYDEVLNAPAAVFPDGRPADVIHACTPREAVRRFVSSYMGRLPTPFVIYLEDNEVWISMRVLGVDAEVLSQLSESEISQKLPPSFAHPFRYEGFIGLADAVAVIQDKLAAAVPPWVRCETVMIGADLEFFSPRPPDPSLRAKYGLAESEKVIVYHGGINQFTRSAIETLCTAVGVIRQRGYPCRLLRSGRNPLDFLDHMPHETASAILDLGLIPRKELPDLLALADCFVQPGQPDAFEDLRLPGKIPEFLAMARPVILADANVSYLFRDGFDAVLLRTGSADEIATKCIELFSGPERANEIGRAGHLLAEKYFDVRRQARRLEQVYESARKDFSAQIASQTWRGADESTPVQLLLARKLRLLADVYDTRDGLEAGAMLSEYARCIEAMEQRMRGLDATLAERDREIAALKQAIEGFRESKSWKLTSPLRKVGSVLKSISRNSTD